MFLFSMIVPVAVRLFSASISGEPIAPHLLTSVPGPRSKQLIQDLGKIQVMNDKFEYG